MSRLEIDPGERPDHMPPPQARRPARFGGIAKAVSAAVAVAALAWGVRYGSDYFTAPPTPSGPVPKIRCAPFSGSQPPVSPLHPAPIIAAQAVVPST